jgi:hypothetical protein
MPGSARCPSRPIAGEGPFSPSFPRPPHVLFAFSPPAARRRYHRLARRQSAPGRPDGHASAQGRHHQPGGLRCVGRQDDRLSRRQCRDCHRHRHRHHRHADRDQRRHRRISPGHRRLRTPTGARLRARRAHAGEQRESDPRARLRCAVLVAEWSLPASAVRLLEHRPDRGDQGRHRHLSREQSPGRHHQLPHPQTFLHRLDRSQGARRLPRALSHRGQHDRSRQRPAGLPRRRGRLHRRGISRLLAQPGQLRRGRGDLSSQRQGRHHRGVRTRLPEHLRPAEHRALCHQQPARPRPDLSRRRSERFQLQPRRAGFIPQILHRHPGPRCAAPADRPHRLPAGSQCGRGQLPRPAHPGHARERRRECRHRDDSFWRLRQLSRFLGHQEFADRPVRPRCIRPHCHARSPVQRNAAAHAGLRTQKRPRRPELPLQPDHRRLPRIPHPRPAIPAQGSGPA